MAAIASVFTIARVAELLGEDEEWLQEISIEMMPEDGIIAVYGVGDDYMPASLTTASKICERRSPTANGSSARKQLKRCTDRPVTNLR
jgi:hypothetical protein